MVEDASVWGGLIAEQERERLQFFFDFDDVQPLTADQLGSFLYFVGSLDAIVRGDASEFPVMFGPAGLPLESRTPVLSAQTEHCLVVIVLAGIGVGTAIAGGIRRIVQIRKEWKLGDKAEAEAELAEGRNEREKELQAVQLEGLRAKRRLDEGRAEFTSLDTERVRQEMHTVLLDSKVPLSDSQSLSAAAAALGAVATAVVYDMPTVRAVSIDVGDVKDQIDLAS
jgi:hypothetical protein